MFIPASDLMYGDVIVENRRDVVVREIDRDSCSKRNVHVNGDSCYDSSVTLNVRRHGKIMETALDIKESRI
jgi:hypothetical protein